VIKVRKVGSIKVYWGSMFSQKTTHLIRDLQSAGEGAVCFKPATDNRDAVDIIRTHDGTEFPAVTVDEAWQIMWLLDDTTTHIGIEEASLFLDDPSLIPTIEMLRDMGYHVIVTGLDLTAEGAPFGQMPIIAAIADECIKLRATCADCGNPASISHYKGRKKGVVAIGGANLYEPLCRDCWTKKKQEGEGA
jgi:thymidine kinase